METINGKTLEDYTPDVGSDEVVERLMRGEGNRHEIAQRIAIERAPLELLPPALRRVRREIESAKAADAKAKAKEHALLDIQRSIPGKEAQVKSARQRLNGAETAAQQCAAIVETFAADVAAVHFESGYEQAIALADAVLSHERLATVMPAAIEKLRAELATRESELESLRKKLET